MFLIDLSKAFDSICHSTLLLKLSGLGTSSQALKWFDSNLTDREQSTRLGTSLSDALTIPHGLPQGSILGPMLFNLYINGLPSAVKSSCTDSYVDDTKFCCSFSAKLIFCRDKAAPKQGIRHQYLSSTKNSLWYPQLKT